MLDELARVRMEVGLPPLAAPVGPDPRLAGAPARALGAALGRRRGRAPRPRPRAATATPPGRDRPGRRARRAAALAPDGGEAEPPAALEELRAQAGGLAASEEELLLLALFGDDAEPLLQAIRGRAARDEALAAGGVDQDRAERIREIVRIVQESGIAEVTIEEDDFRVTVRRTDDRPRRPPVANAAPLAVEEPGLGAGRAARRTGSSASSRRWSASSTAQAQPGEPPFVEVGDVVAAGQTLCILEAMKLINEVKAEVEGVVRAVHAENGSPVEFGQLLFELEPLNCRPLDAV